MSMSDEGGWPEEPAAIGVGREGRARVGQGRWAKGGMGTSVTA